MVTIKVLGPGCANCKRLEELAKLALDEVKAERPGLEGSVEKITDVERFLDYGVMTTPGLVINEQVVSTGRLPSPQTIAGWIRDAAGS